MEMHFTAHSGRSERYRPLREYCQRQRQLIEHNQAQLEQLRQKLHRRIDQHTQEQRRSTPVPYAPPTSRRLAPVEYRDWLIFIRKVSQGYMISVVSPKGRAIDALSVCFPQPEAARQFACRYIDWLSDSGEPLRPR